MSGGAIHPLNSEQQAAVLPRRNIWLSASAGTGKTQVLTARVLRLLLTDGVAPENILCLTFTKAGAAEMANRISQTLARWVRQPALQLAPELRAIGAEFNAAAQARARELFARLLDAPGGGIRILTIHSFCQALLGAFPVEAGLVPGFRALEEHEAMALRRATLAELIAGDGDGALAAALSGLAEGLGEGAAAAYLDRCAGVADAMASVPDDVAGATIFTRRLVGSTIDGDADGWLERACADAALDRDALIDLAVMLERWGKRDGPARAARIRAWLAAPAAQRAATLADLHLVWATDAGVPRSVAKGFCPPDDTYADAAAAAFAWADTLLGEQRLARFADRQAHALVLGRAYALAYAGAKRRGGLVDFDDLIRDTARLLADPAMGDWIRFKLDQRVDHVLVDEAQDTNAAQWQIIRALTGDYFAGSGARGDRARTLFTVGDFKQAIYGFQGTSPDNYEAAGRLIAVEAAGAGAAFDLLDLAQSFRSTEPVLTFVDAVVAEVGAPGFGMRRPIAPHRAVRGPTGTVTLLAPFRLEWDGQGSDAGEEGWIPDTRRVFATELARMVRGMIDDPACRLANGRRVTAGDIMILVRRRGDLAGPLVARLHAVGVPVAGIDRLRLDAPLAVRDVMAAARFALQPLDDLNLAALLVSPLLGWSQDNLMDCALGRGDRPLWRWLRERHGDMAGMDVLNDILARTDYVTPHRFLEDLLGGALDGRRRLAARLGPEIDDPLGELLNAALAFEATGEVALQAFVDWFDRGEIDVKREAGSAGDAVRVMTVHGAKGLQAPVVILADATADPARSAQGGIAMPFADTRLPLLPVTKADARGQLAELVARHGEAEAEEHARLLYVALTRAEEHLVIAGALSVNERAPSERSWHRVAERAMARLRVAARDDPVWRARWVHAGAPPPDVPAQAPPVPPVMAGLPAWLLAPAPAEARPPRPLAPSAMPEDDGAVPPATNMAMRMAARRGALLHSLFERLPALPVAARLGAATAWLARQAGDMPASARDAICDAALTLIADPAWADLFAPDALAEVPLAAAVGDTVVTGRIDRLVLNEDMVRVVDFKTGGAIPETTDAVPIPHVRQMAWYAAALARIYPGRRIVAALLYTAGPRLIVLPPDLLARYSPA